ncbi:hypothetical protein [Streptomyces sp. NPDC058755]|uniref:hypothetical protein n=1 Tax=Streptomyces sp. NPDC058755 TaxID=3346624 RepID=UPI0036B30D1D
MAGAWWVRERVESREEVLLGQEVAAAREVKGGLRPETPAWGRGADAGGRAHQPGDRVPGRPERRRPLSPELRALPATAADGAPEVGLDFESSYPAGLFLAGLVTAPGFGPAMRLGHGATFTAGTLLVRGVQHRLRAGPADPGRTAWRGA